jgi:RimJ/RimL family protein N-acetyltransferase
MAIEYKVNELYREIELFHDGIKIGEAEVDVNGKMLSRLNIYEPYQGKGYGTEVVRELTERYGLIDLWVNADNARAIHVYEKCGYNVKEPTMYRMVREKWDTSAKNT